MRAPTLQRDDWITVRDEQTLHPNLGRIAAAYDDIVDKHTRGLLTASAARGQALALHARDDHGIIWRINPDTSKWEHKTRTQEWKTAIPPAYGLATSTAFDVAPNPASRAFNPDSRINFHQVDESLLHPPSSLEGSTRRKSATHSASLLSKLNRAWTTFLEKPLKDKLVVVVILVLLIVLISIVL